MLMLKTFMKKSNDKKFISTKKLLLVYFKISFSYLYFLFFKVEIQVTYLKSCDFKLILTNLILLNENMTPRKVFCISSLRNALFMKKFHVIMK